MGECVRCTVKAGGIVNIVCGGNSCECGEAVSPLAAVRKGRNSLFCFYQCILFFLSAIFHLSSPVPLFCTYVPFLLISAYWSRNSLVSILLASPSLVYRGPLLVCRLVNVFPALRAPSLCFHHSYNAQNI